MVFEKKGKQKAKKTEATPRRPTSRSGGCMFLNPLGSFCDASGEMKWGFQGEKKADLSLLSALTQESGMLWVRTTQASLQFIILRGRAQLPRRQLSTARDPDIKPHSDCWMKKHYHLAANLIMLREGGEREWERDSCCHQNIYKGRINQSCHTQPPDASLPRSKSGGPPDCVINLIFCFYCQLHNVQQLIRRANKCSET